jgi:hypothetical protein
VFDRALGSTALAGIVAAKRLRGNEDGLLAALPFEKADAGEQLPKKLRGAWPNNHRAYHMPVSSNRASGKDNDVFHNPFVIGAIARPLRLPFKKGEVWRVMQGYDAPDGSHRSAAAFCWDLVLEKPDAIPSDVELLVDGRPIPRAAWSTPIPVDPGERQIMARRKGHAPWSTRVTITGEVRAHPLIVPQLVPLPPEPEPVAGPARSETRSARLGTLPFIAGAFVAVAGIGAGSFLGLQAIERKRERDRECDATGCSEKGLDKQNEAGTAAIGSTVAFGVGLAGAAFAAIWYLRPLAKTSGDGKTTLSAGCVTSSCSMHVSGSF